ncbi:MAG: hypothetical protein IKJ11_07090 [Clostridia bacterium]|nr:hypothetical protein [Clostridia bacterium]
MNTNSYLCRFLAEHPEGWETLLLKKYGIKSKREAAYAIFNYGFNCNFADPMVQEARGIILDTQRLEVVCWPFRKFGNHTESYADSIDWTHARVQEKVDGSIIKLWYDAVKGDWQFSTNGTIRAEHAPVGELSKTTFCDVIRSADNFGSIPFDSLDRNMTYIFELVSPATQVVVPYETTMLYHIGTRSNLTGQELDADIGIRKPMTYPIHSLAECVETAIRLNRTDSSEIKAEGFVVVDDRWNRVKVKSPDYIAKHHLMQMKSITKRECIQMLLSSPEDAATACRANPELIPMFKFYDYHLARLEHLANRIGAFSRQLYDEYSHDRGAVARVIGRHPLAVIGFRCIESDAKGSHFLKQFPLEKLCKSIPDYQEEDLSALFLSE